MTAGRKLSVYETLIENIKRDIGLGIVAAGEKLPSCRELALKLGINPNTVQRAYSELEAQGVIYTIPKKGAFVTPREKPDRLGAARAAAESLKSAGITREELIKVIEEVYDD